jgi:hypothetical protein
MTMEQHSNAGTRPGNPFRLSSRQPGESLTPETPRFHIFLIDTGWNRPVSKVLRSQFPLFRAYHPKDPLYILTQEQSIRVLQRAPELIGFDPIIVVYDLRSPAHAKGEDVENYRGFRLNLGLFKNPEQALQRLQHFVRFIAVNRTSDSLISEVRREMHKEGLENLIKIMGEASEASIELL